MRHRWQRTLYGSLGGLLQGSVRTPSGVLGSLSTLSTCSIPQCDAVVESLAGDSHTFLFCLLLFLVLRVALGVAHAAVVVDVLPLSLPSSLLLSGQLGWWLVVLAASGVSCLQLRLYAAVYHCCCLSPAADVAAAGRKMIYSLGAVVAAAGLLQRCAGSSSWLAACPPVFDWASCQTSFLQLLLLMWLLLLEEGACWRGSNILPLAAAPP